MRDQSNMADDEGERGLKYTVHGWSLIGMLYTVVRLQQLAGAALDGGGNCPAPVLSPTV